MAATPGSAEGRTSAGWARGAGGCGAGTSARFGQCAWAVGSGSVVPAWEPRHAVPELLQARSWCWQIINNDSDYESAVHVPLGLC